MFQKLFLIVLLLFSTALPAYAKDPKAIKSYFELNQKQTSSKTIMFVARRATKTIFNYIPISTDDVGHTFVAILEYDNGKIKKFTTYGKYPDGLITNGKYDYADMALIAKGKDLDRLKFEELIISDYQLAQIININSQEGYYDLFNSNCAHYMQRIMNSMLWYHNGIAGGTENPAKYHEFFGNRRAKL
jgi:hypothetical protein